MGLAPCVAARYARLHSGGQPHGDFRARPSWKNLPIPVALVLAAEKYFKTSIHPLPRSSAVRYTIYP